eukprot:TRINITY_DN11556_c0_g6_i2.p1 TRINITY_DN11556_c0_g6~~TRINITY_DN11556_c0_g6_i2.p1  ORF type:complete len:435 (+),score=94.32 TRINITY_DN11556_c0_g6_i2:436-1740(+)
MDGGLSFKEFLPIILPLANDKIRQELVERDNYSIHTNEPLPDEVESNLAQLLIKEAEYFLDTEKELTSLLSRHDFNYQLMFKMIDIRYIGSLNYDALSAYLKKRHMKYQPADVNAFIRRADRDLDCKVSYEEFVETFSLSNAKEKLIKTRCVTPNRKIKSTTARTRSTNKQKSVIEKQGRESDSPPMIKVSLTPYKIPSESASKTNLTSSTKRLTKLLHSATVTKSAAKLPSAKTVKRPAKKSPVYGLMQQQLDSERRVEALKQSLALHDDFTVQRAWNVLATKGRDTITATELFDSLKGLGLNPDKEATYLIFNRFLSEPDAKWRAGNVEELVAPSEKIHQQMLKSRAVANDSKKLNKDTLILFKRLLKTYMEIELKNENCKKYVEKANLRKVFNEFDREERGYFTPENVSARIRHSSNPFCKLTGCTFCRER